MFEDSLVESAALLNTQNRWPAVLSFTAQLCAAALVLTIPLLHPEVLPMRHMLPATLASPRPPVPAPPPVHLDARAVSARVSAPGTPAAPRSTSLVRDVLHPSGPPVEAPSLPVIDLGNTSAALPPGINTGVPAAPHVTLRPAATAVSKPLNISQGVSAGHLLAPIRPVYPQIARVTHTEGTVVVDAVISRTGAIEAAQVVSGPAMLCQAALEAVRQARYRPFLLNGQPTEVQTTITITFRMSS